MGSETARLWVEGLRRIVAFDAGRPGQNNTSPVHNAVGRELSAEFRLISNQRRVITPIARRWSDMSQTSFTADGIVNTARVSLFYWWPALRIDGY